MATGDDFLTRFRPGHARPDAARPDANKSEAGRLPEDDDFLTRLEEKAREQPMPGAARVETPPEGSSGPPGASGEQEGDEPLPGEDEAYRAHSRAANKPHVMIGFVLREMPLEAFAYSDLRRVRMFPPDQPGGGPFLVLRFVEAGITDVEIRGRNLHGIADYLRQHRLAWLREIPARRDVRDPTAAVITSIVIRAAGE